MKQAARDRGGGTKNYNMHNSLIFWATDSRFSMEVFMDSANKLQKYKKKYKVLITQPFFELQTQYFAWKFIFHSRPKLN